MSNKPELQFGEFVDTIANMNLENDSAKDTAHSSAVSVKPWEHVADVAKKDDAK